MTTRFTAAVNENFSLYLSNKDTLYKLYKLQIIKTDLDYIACLHLIKAQKSRINYQVNRMWRQHRRCNVTEPFPVENTFTLIRKFESKMFPHISPQSLGHLWFCIFCFVLTKRTKIALIFGQILTNQLHFLQPDFMYNKSFLQCGFKVCNIPDKPAENCCLTLKYSNPEWRNVTETNAELCRCNLRPNVIESLNVKWLPTSAQAFVYRVHSTWLYL